MHLVSLFEFALDADADFVLHCYLVKWKSNAFSSIIWICFGLWL